MIAPLVRCVVLLLVVVLSYVVIMWIMAYLHIYINGLFIPNELRWQNGMLKADQSQWVAVGMIINLIEWIKLVWLSNRLNRWYTVTWPLPAQKWVATLGTIVVAGATGITLFILFYSHTHITYF